MPQGTTGASSGELLNAKKLRFSPQPGLRKIQHPFYSQTVEYQSSKMWFFSDSIFSYLIIVDVVMLYGIYIIFNKTEFGIN